MKILRPLILCLLTVITCSFTPYVAQVTGSQVRLRLDANYDAAIFKELPKGQILYVVGEKGDFYAVVPPEELKGYIWRNYILDGKVDATALNVRLAPSTEAPIIGQLQKGQQIEGKVLTNNTKWLEIDACHYCAMFISKQYVEKTEAPVTNVTLPTFTMVEERLIVAEPAMEEAILLPTPIVSPSTTTQPTIQLSGIISPYVSAVTNPPGHFTLTCNNIPVAFLNSPTINLRDWVGKEVTITAVERFNRHFAYPAYTVLSIETR